MKKSGLYLLRFSDGRFYGGRSFNMEGRSSQHSFTLKFGRHRNRNVQKAFDETGLFVFEVLEFIDDQEALLKREQEWLDLNHGKPGCLNIFSSAKGRQLGFKHSEETRAKFRLRTVSETTRKKISETLRGRILSLSHRTAISRGNMGKTLSDSHRKVLIECNKARAWTPEIRSRQSKAHLGHVRSEESVIKQVESWRSRPENIEKARASIAENSKHITPEAIARRAIKAAEKNRGKKHSPEHIEKIRVKHLGRKNTPQTIEKMRQAALMRCQADPTSNGEVTRPLISAQRRGRVWVNNGEINRRVLREEVDQFLTEGWVAGTLSGLKTRIRRESLPRKSPGRPGLLWIHKPDEGQRRILEEDLDFFLDAGWILGQSRFTQDLTWIHRGGDEDAEAEYKRVPRDSLEAWISDGWVPGHITLSEIEKARRSQLWTPEMRAAARSRAIANPPPQPTAEARSRGAQKRAESLRGVPLSEEHRRKMSEAQRERWSTIEFPEERRERLREKARLRHQENPELWVTSEEKREKVRQSSTGRIWLNNGSENRFMKSDDAEVEALLSSGLWHRGKLPDRKPRKRPSAERIQSMVAEKRGKVAVNNGSVCRMVFPDEAEALIAEGWLRGRV